MADRAHAASSTRALVAGGVVLAIPLVGLVLLLARPSLDLHWEHHPAHFWLVFGVAATSAVLAYATGVAAVRRGDARVMLVSLTFLASATFLGLHALATPGVLLEESNAGFSLATPVGLSLGSVFAALSGLDLAGSRSAAAMRWAKAGRAGLVLFMAVWAVASLASLPPLDSPAAPERASGGLLVLALPAIGLYAAAAARYLQLWLRRRSLMLLAMLAAFVLLAEAMVAVVFARNWHVSWWEWHVLMLAAFVLVAAGARIQWHEERFADLYLAQTRSGTRDMSVLFADLQGFTAYSERHPAAEVTAMLNEYFEAAVPAVRRYGGEVDRIIGDALMVTFNSRGEQGDHAERAARAGLALQRATGAVAAQHPGWPRFRVGINSGPVQVSVLGAAGGRTHTVIGDVVNVASRIEGKAPAGRVAISLATLDRLPAAVTESLGLLELKGKAEPIETYVLVSLGPPD